MPPLIFMKHWNDDDYFYWSVLIAVPLIIVIGILAINGILPLTACFFFTKWGIYCPGCGGTRSLLALIDGRILQAVYYHPVFILALFFIPIYLVIQSVCRLAGSSPPKGLVFRRSWIYALFILLIGNCLVRNLLLLFFSIPI